MEYTRIMELELMSKRIMICPECKEEVIIFLGTINMECPFCHKGILRAPDTHDLALLIVTRREARKVHRQGLK